MTYRRIRRGFAALLGFVSFALPAGGCSESPDQHYRKHHDGKSLYEVLYKQVKPGDSIEKVQGLLGPGEPAESRARRAIEKFAQKTPDRYPDGYRETDTLLDYPMDGGSAILQFRDGRLINHNPEDCAHYEPIINAVAAPQTQPATPPE